MTVLMVGDVVGNPGRRILRRELKGLKARFGAAAAVVNAENCAAGSGITAALAEEIFDAGADAITLGDHTWGQKEFAAQIGGVERLVRPANFAAECPGRGWCIVNLPVGRLAVLNLQGRVFMQAADCPFKAADRALAEIPKDVPVVVDFHAEATSEKATFAHYLDGRVAAVAGTHTHVQTSDARLLPKGTAYITDRATSSRSPASSLPASRRASRWPRDPARSRARRFRSTLRHASPSRSSPSASGTEFPLRRRRRILV